MAILAESRIRATIPRQQPAVEVEIEPRFRVTREPRAVLLFHSLHNNSKFLRFYEIATDSSSLPRFRGFSDSSNLRGYLYRWKGAVITARYGDRGQPVSRREERREEKSRRAGSMR